MYRKASKVQKGASQPSTWKEKKKQRKQETAGSLLQIIFFLSPVQGKHYSFSVPSLGLQCRPIVKRSPVSLTPLRSHFCQVYASARTVGSNSTF